MDFVIRSRRVVIDGDPHPASVHVTDGTIAAITPYDEPVAGTPLEDVGNLVILPGLVDTHVHINDPGRADWEGFETATRAAAAGGVTTIVDMPLNSVPPTTTLAGLEAKARAAEGHCYVDVGFCGGAVPGNVRELTALADRGVLAFKCFLVESGVEEFGHVAEPELEAALRKLTGIGVPLLVHAELPGPIDAAAKTPASDARRYDGYLRSRPRQAENDAVSLVVRLARALRARAHIVHLSSSDALEPLARARDAGVSVTAETCPHYLTFAAEDIPDGATEYKCAPPIRERDNRERLWDALRQGLIDQVVTDHSPSTPALKCSGSGDFSRAWGGIASLQLGLPATFTEARRRGQSLAHVAEWMARAPARLVGLDRRKGRIAVGHDADLVVWDPDGDFTVAPEMIHHRHKITPYMGRTLHGVVHSTYLRGARIYDRGEFAAPSGRWLRRGHA